MRVLIVEDERTIARRLERLLRELAGPELESVELFEELSEAEPQIAAGGVDVLFLDLDLNGEDGFELIRDLVARPFQVVVVSAHTERAIEAYELGVIDFVPKPFGKERLRKTLERVRAQLEPVSTRRVAARLPGRIDLVPIEDILWIKAEGPHSVMHLVSGEVVTTTRTLEQVHEALGASFERLHRSYVVRLDRVTRILVSEGSRYRVLLTSGDEVPLGRSRVVALRRRLEGPE